MRTHFGEAENVGGYSGYVQVLILVHEEDGGDIDAIWRGYGGDGGHGMLGDTTVCLCAWFNIVYGRGSRDEVNVSRDEVARDRSSEWVVI